MKTDINCREAERLARYTGDELTEMETALLEGHLASCPGCKAIRREFLAGRAASLQAGKVPPTPDFSLLAGKIVALPFERVPSTGRRARGTLPRGVITLARYASGIAAIFLLVLFTWEQALAVKKLSSLQSRIQLTVTPPDPGIIDRITMARAALVEAGWADLAGKLPPAGAVFTVSDLAKARAMIQGRIRFMKAGGRSTDKAMSFLITYRNALTYKDLLK